MTKHKIQMTKLFQSSKFKTKKFSILYFETILSLVFLTLNLSRNEMYYIY
jgi:hypothetical protein